MWQVKCVVGFYIMLFDGWQHSPALNAEPHMHPHGEDLMWVHIVLEEQQQQQEQLHLKASACLCDGRSRKQEWWKGRNIHLCSVSYLGLWFINSGRWLTDWAELWRPAEAADSLTTGTNVNRSVSHLIYRKRTERWTIDRVSNWIVQQDRRRSANRNH